MNRAAVVLNLQAGRFVHVSEADARREVEVLFHRNGVRAEVFAAQGDALANAVAEAFRSGGETVYSVGGDGTVRGLLEGVLRHDRALGILPAGTLNMAARDLGIPDDLESAVAAVAGAPVRAIDVGQVNDRYFLCASMLGMMPLLAVDREAKRGASLPAKMQGWTRALLRGWWRYPVLRGEVVHGGGRHPFVARGLAVSANPFASSPLNPLKRASLDGGELALYISPSHTRLDTLRLTLHLAGAPWDPGPSLVRKERDGLDIDIDHASKILVMNDGELDRLALPLRYRLHPRRLRVLAPDSPAGDCR